jgi:hypothetical protein
MISIIALCRNSTSLSHLSKNVQQTSGGRVEFIGIDNTLNSYDIPAAYNESLQKASGDIFCFIHDDVEFVIQGWDLIIENHFGQTPNIGVLGSAGGAKFCTAPSSWWTKRTESEIHMSYLVADGSAAGQRFDNLKEVIGIDGFILAVRKEHMLNDFQWSSAIGSFHGYDLDLCLHMCLNVGLSNFVLPEIIIQHNSPGSNNIDWAHSMIRIWKKYYPGLAKMNDNEVDVEALTFFIGMTKPWCEIKSSLCSSAKELGFSEFFILGIRMQYSDSKIFRSVGYRLLRLFAKRKASEAMNVGKMTSPLSGIQKSRL